MLTHDRDHRAPRRRHLGRAGRADRAGALWAGWRGGGAAVAEAGLLDAGPEAADARGADHQGQPLGHHTARLSGLCPLSCGFRPFYRFRPLRS